MTADAGAGGTGSEECAPSFRSVWKTGAVAGLIGSGAVALAQGVADLVLGRPLVHTPEVLGRGLGGWSAVAGASGPILVFTLFHVAAFLVIGIALAAAARAGTAARFRWTSSLLFIAVFFGSATMAEALDPLEQALPTWSVVVANVAALAMIGWVVTPRTGPGSAARRQG